MDTLIVPQSQPNTKAVFIYVLIDPFTDLIRYVGKATKPEVRFRRHIKDARDGKRDHKSNWISSVLSRNRKPVLAIIETCGADWKKRETYWIAKLRVDGFDLTNSKSGGDGFEPCEETRKKMSAAKKGKPPHNKGKSTSLEAKAKQSASAKARFFRMTPDEKQQYIKPALANPPKNLKGWHHTDEAKAKISAAGMGNKHTLGHKATEETKKRLSQAKKGHAVSDETRKKISEVKRRKNKERKDNH